MRVFLAKGRLDPEAELRTRRTMPPPAPPALYMNSAIIEDLAVAGRNRGWDIENLFVGEKSTAQISTPDVIVNGITEPAVCQLSLWWLDRVVGAHDLPILNSGEAVRRSSRPILSALLAKPPSDQSRVRMPLSTHFTGAIGELGNHVEASGHRWPVLIRPPGAHGSVGLRLIDGPDTISDGLERVADLLVTDFVDFRSPDGYYRKYRMVWIDGKIFRRHMIAADHWMLTGAARKFMGDRDDLRGEERAFLASGGGALDRRIAGLFRLVGLDFAVIDFGLTEADEIIVFELNGNFQVTDSIPAEGWELWGFLEDNNEAILNAILDSVERRAGARATQARAPEYIDVPNVAETMAARRARIRHMKPWDVPPER